MLFYLCGFPCVSILPFLSYRTLDLVLLLCTEVSCKYSYKSPSPAFQWTSLRYFPQQVFFGCRSLSTCLIFQKLQCYYCCIHKFPTELLKSGLLSFFNWMAWTGEFSWPCVQLFMEPFILQVLAYSLFSLYLSDSVETECWFQRFTYEFCGFWW